MAYRTTIGAVKGIMEPGRDYNGHTDLMPFIATANAVVNRVVNLAVTARNMAIQSTDAELIERWLAAHFYCQSDKTYQSKSTQGASGSFTGQTAMGLKSTLYGQTAKVMDPSGVLEAIDERKFAGGHWLGKVSSEWIPYDQRTDQ